MSVLDGNDTIGIMATGGGKSLCYQLPGVYLGGLTLVISPLISLMKDQIDDLNARGIPAAAFNSSLDYRERVRIESELKTGSIRLLFISPEKCMQPNFLEFLKSSPVRLIAIDEAHCISEWGHNFRPEYRQLAQLKKFFPTIPVVALTATAVPEVRSDISQQLGLSGAQEFIGSFNRKNLEYRVIPKKNPMVFLTHFIGQHRADAGIIYCLSKKETEEIAEDLRKRGFTALAYHAGLSSQVREKVQDAFIRGTVRIICATVAFGMGIDKADVRYVIHYDLPKTIESYYQETGRAGRDGKPGECVLLFSRGDYGRVRWMLENDNSTGQHLKIGLRKLQEMVDYCETTGCRRRFLLRYFGETFEEENCRSCDNCAHPRHRIDGTDRAVMIARCVHQLRSPFGIELIADVLRGSRGAKIKEYGFEALPSYGTGKYYSKPEYRSWINEMVRQGYLIRTGEQYPVISLTVKGNELLQGNIRVMLPVEGTSDSGPRSAEQKNVPVQGKDDEDLFLRLKGLRRTIAERDGIPPYMVFPDTSLREMARIRPCDREGFATINGVGGIKLDRFGPEFIAEIKRSVQEPGK